MTFTHALIAAGASMCLLGMGCDYFSRGGGVRIEVHRKGSDYLVVLTSCRGKPVGVHEIRIAQVDVSTSTPAEVRYNDAQYCGVEVPMSKPIEGTWRYGTTPRDGLIAKCLPLKPGTYVASVSGGGEPGAYRDFRIESDGSVTLQQGTCD